MNKKQLIIAALATVMSVSAANATNITGATQSGNTYNVTPENFAWTSNAKTNAVGYRKYDNFTLSQGDIANLIFNYSKNGKDVDVQTFINMMQNGFDINGVLNTVGKNGAFTNGHAVFISPNGMTVGSSGVLNVGTLSVITPDQTKFNRLLNGYANGDYTEINQLNKMRNNTVTNNNNYGGNGPVKIDGYVFTRNGADIRGSQVDVAGGIVNGYNGNSTMSSASAAATLFNSLVNTNGIAASASQILNNGSNVVIKSGEGTGALNVTGKIANLANGELAITNHGSNGLNLEGAVVAGNGKVNVYNNETAKALTMDANSKVFAHKDSASLSSKGGLNVASGAQVKALNNVELVNKGGDLVFNGTALAGGKIDVFNHNESVNAATSDPYQNSNARNLTIGGTLGDSSTDVVRIVNNGNGKLTFTGTANATEDVSLRNHGTAMQVDGTINAGRGVLVHNEGSGALTVGNDSTASSITVQQANSPNVAIAIYNENGTGLTIGSKSTIRSNNGNIAIKNAGANGMNLKGTVTNVKGDTAINNMAGGMTVAGTINNQNGNTGIYNYGTGKMNVNGTITNAGKLKIANVNGRDGMTISSNAKITNTKDNFGIYNYEGGLELDGQVANSGGGFLFIHSKSASDGITTGTNSVISNNGGDLAIKHNGSGTDGLYLQGTVNKTGNGELAINNYRGDLDLEGDVNTTAQSGIINRAGSDDMSITGTVTTTGNKTLNIKNEAGSGDMTVAGTINHDGRLNVLNNSGTLTLDGTIKNNGSARTHIIARDPRGGNTAREGGIVATQNFNATATNGDIYINNKVGEDGLQFKGTAKSTNGFVELYNMQGDMVVNGGTVQGGKAENSTIILNKGGKLTVTSAATVAGPDAKIVNKGTAAAVDQKFKDIYYEELK